jgi:hypothetical protein
MREILLISDKQEYFNIFYNSLGRLPIHLSLCESIDEVIHALPLEQSSWIFMVTDSLEALEDWVDQIASRNLDIPIVVFTKRLEQDVRERLWQKNITELIQLPKHHKEFDYVIESILMDQGKIIHRDNSFIQGYLHDFPFIELIKTFSDTGKNGILTVFRGNWTGVVQFNKGKIVNAHLREYEPLDAIRTMATWFTGTFKMNLDKTAHHVYFSLDNQQILAKCQEEIRNRNTLARELPNLNLIFYTTPELNYEQFDPGDRKILLHFKDGATLNYVIDMFPGHSVKILERIKKWLADELLIKRAEYNERVMIIEEKEKVSGIRKLFTKVFSKSSSDEVKIQPDIADEEISMEEEVAQRIRKRDQIFNDFSRLNGFIEALEDMQ